MTLGYYQQKKLLKGFSLVVLVIILIIVLFPVYWMINTSLKSDSEIYRRVPTMFPEEITLESYEGLFTSIPYARQLGNSFYVSITATFIGTSVSIFAAYSLARLKFWGRNFASGLMFSAYMLPISVLFIPIFLLMFELDLIDNHFSLILAYQIQVIPFATWMLRSYFANIPRELEEAARVDGTSRVGAILRITLPLSAPGIVAAFIFSFTATWNEFLLALVLVTKQDLVTAPVGLHNFIIGDFFLWGQIMAGAVVMGIPIFIIYLIAQRFVVTGLTAGSVKT